MNYKKIIDNRIKEIYKDKKDFSEELEIDPKDLASKMKTIVRAIERANNTLTKLGMKIYLIEK